MTAPGAEPAHSPARGFPIWASVALALLCAVALTWSRALEIWRSGAFFDSDDAMRAVQVRDLLAGQSWFDMTAWRLDPPNGVVSHWSRVVDAPLAALESFFRLFLAPQYAERIVRLLFPLALLAALLRLAAWLSYILAPSASQHLAVLLAFLSGAALTQFIPGRIDHHAPQIVLLLTALGLFLKGIEAEKARAMAGASLAMSVSIAISLENAPFFAVMLAALPALFVVDGERMRAPLAWFAASGLLCFPLLYGATVAPARYLVSACDAYSWVYLAAAFTGLLGLAALAALAPYARTPAARAAAAAAAGAAVVATMAAVAPKCLGDPLAGIDPLVREFWLSHVTEATPLLKFRDGESNVVIMIALPVAIGLAATLWEAFSAKQAAARRRRLVLAGVIAAGFAAGLWQVRVFTSTMPIAMIALAGTAGAVAGFLTRGFSAVTRGLTAAIICFAVSPMGVAAALPVGEGTAEMAEQQKSKAACLQPKTLEPLAALDPAPVAAPFDLGPYLLAYTPHSAFAGPYHRDNHGNRIVIDAFLAPPDQAERILRAAGARLLLWCHYEPGGFAKKAPDGLGAALARGEIPSWLAPLPQTSERLLVFALRP
ncbi:hypothetical protein [Methylocystis heyeri]|uniref:Glycosyltransferase RgtA/B/C/D-like domain-containing protein n=1 Tax=Methylocystis heyeri TaxID=391905 RepID=A0A6B8KG74_9HYPH|nr:hypothetical protein [Methylocystis heyeri]QGM46612.1 hypothetical protein H2LOC_013405 [Methylocystis heyeri]